mmetsp:Transcript_22742/g.49814  ORF Transcript_22742/g.49814 Transcript_22742/m.49814 type:complete len:188 (-) Transcript_22742:788-1351(-)
MPAGIPTHLNGEGEGEGQARRCRLPSLKPAMIKWVVLCGRYSSCLAAGQAVAGAAPAVAPATVCEVTEASAGLLQLILQGVSEPGGAAGSHVQQAHQEEEEAEREAEERGEGSYVGGLSRVLSVCRSVCSSLMTEAAECSTALLKSSSIRKHRVMCKVSAAAAAAAGGLIGPSSHESIRNSKVMQVQ